MFSGAFWSGALERAAKTVAQSLLALWLVGDVAFNLLTVDWGDAAGVALGAGVISLLTSIMSLPFGPADSPSMVGEAQDA